MKTLLGFIAISAFAIPTFGQATGVTVYHDSATSSEHAKLTNAVERIRQSGKALTATAAREQLQRGSCRLNLPPPNQTKLTTREIWQRARASHLRVGWYYQCTKCDEWHLNLAGGYLLTNDGAAATSYHVAEPPRDLREGCLVAVTESGKVFAVREVLAAERGSDACIIRLDGDGFTPLPLNTNAHPGDVVYCLSDPLGRRGYFSQGIINRFFALPERRRVSMPGAPAFSPTRIHVSVEWSPGSSGSAVLDECGNAIGQVSAVTLAEQPKAEDHLADGASNQHAAMVFREAVSARDMLALIKAERSER